MTNRSTVFKPAIPLVVLLLAVAAAVWVFLIPRSLGRMAGLPDAPEALLWIEVEAFTSMEPHTLREQEALEELSRVLRQTQVRYAGPSVYGYVTYGSRSAYKVQAACRTGADEVIECPVIFIREDGYVVLDGRQYQIYDQQQQETLLRLLEMALLPTP